MAKDAVRAMGMAYQNMGKEIPEPDSVEFRTEDGEIVTCVNVEFCRVWKS